MAYAAAVFEKCVNAIRRGELIHRTGDKDKEFHFQNWFKRRLDELGVAYRVGKRNSYPDFMIDLSSEGYELKGLAHPGRWATFDSNSQAPHGRHSGQDIYYVFGRYPRNPESDSYPVIDLVLCHGSFLNTHHDYAHENKSFRGFGSFGDILVRDRKMYVAPTPFAIAEGTVLQRTLILPESEPVPSHLKPVGVLLRRESDRIVAAYSFGLRVNELTTTEIANPNAGLEHRFVAYRLDGDPLAAVQLRDRGQILAEVAEDGGDEAD